MENMFEKLFGFSEIGWPTYNTSVCEEFQYEFLINLSTVLTVDREINLHLFNYCWLHDINEAIGAGLIKRDGTERLGHSAWKQISTS